MCAKRITKPLQLYKHLLRTVKKLPPDSQSYYAHYVRQGFNSHSDETDPERIQQIIDKALEDAEWILAKYTKQNQPQQPKS